MVVPERFVWGVSATAYQWAEGFTKRFGLVHLDPDTLVRTPKASYRWYRDLIAASR